MCERVAGYYSPQKLCVEISESNSWIENQGREQKKKCGNGDFEMIFVRVIRFEN